MRQKGNVVGASFRDLHELESSEYRWDLPLIKISIGDFHGSINSVDLDDVQLIDARFSGTLLQNGMNPEGYTTIAIPAADTSNFWWHYRKVGSNMLLVFPESRALKAISFNGFHVYTLSIENDFLECLIDRFGFIGLGHKIQGQEKVIPIGKRHVLSLNSLLQTVFLKVHVERVLVLPKRLEYTIKYRITELILGLIHQSEEINNIPISRPRDRSVLKAFEYILAQDLQTLSIEEISARTGVKKRSLEYAFKEYVNVGPKSFIKALRLNNFRQVLKKGEASVSEVALQEGFTHMGQLSRDYKLLFGELPSETLRWVKQSN